MEILRQAGILALASMFTGILPLALAIVYAIWPNEQRLSLLRPLSLATVFAAVGGAALGFINVLRLFATAQPPAEPRVLAIGAAESLVPLFFGFGCLTITWLCVALGLWRRP